MKWMTVEKWWNEIFGRGKMGETPRKFYPYSPLFITKPTLEILRLEFGTPAVGDMQQTAYAMGLPLFIM